MKTAASKTVKGNGKGQLILVVAIEARLYVLDEQSADPAARDYIPQYHHRTTIPTSTVVFNRDFRY